MRRALRAIGIADDVARANAIREWSTAATTVVGVDAALTRAVRVEGRTLVVAVPTAQWAAELRLREREIIAVLDHAAPGSGISNIRSVPAEPTRVRSEDEPA